VCSLIARKGTNKFVPNLACLCHKTRRFIKVNSPKSELGSSPDYSGFCSSETKYVRRMVPRTKLFTLARLQE
jgi:hypothetical protein